MSEYIQLNTQMPDASKPITPLQNLNLMDDFLFDVTTVDLESCKIILELSLGIRIRRISWKESQKVIHNLPGKRGIRMDFYVEDDEGKLYDIEMQKRNEGNIPKRTRFYQALSVAKGCDERLMHLHTKIKNIKSNTQMEVTYMKMEERDRLIREDGRAEGICEGEDRISKLTLCLLETKRYEDLEHASKDSDYRELLLKEFGI